MISSSVPLKVRARASQWLGRACVGAIFAALTASACSVPDFQFPEEQQQGFAGDPGVIDHCANGLRDADLGESDFDCGGACNPCGAGQDCRNVADCAEELLCHEGTCVVEGCTNTAQDGAETDVDCGGGDCNRCITGQACNVEQDCESDVCVDAECQAPACDDQVANGKETGRDCGGDCPGCDVDQPCLAGDDCISLECNDGICGPECPDGLANCDKDNSNECEINTRVDVENCGACGNVCALPHAASECSAGECRIQTDGCDEGFADCNGEPEDGCEVDLLQDKLNCGACTKVCPEINGAAFCEEGACQITCAQGFDDCDENRDNGCEKNVSRDVNNCGECKNVCTPASGGTPYCKDDACGETICPAGFGDCNGKPEDGCEIDLRTDADNCDSCGSICVANNASTACVNRACQIDECDTGFQNCGGGYADGCETNINTSIAHCGGCGDVCSVDNGVPKCDMGACAINNCSGTYRDCNSSPNDGCEINIATDAEHCGGCLPPSGSNCNSKYANATADCADSACQQPTCDANYGDCTGGLADGCETDTRSTGAHCGGCNKACQTGPAANVSENECIGSQCQPDCVGSFDTCDGNRYNGCETNTDDDASNCGGCGIVCSPAHVESNECVSGNCQPDCSSSYADCDGIGSNGCEINTATSNDNCGGCGDNFACKQPADASAHVSSNNCSGSECNPVCSGLWGDCDSNLFNGCEHDVSADEGNCGACNIECETENAAATTCTAGVCKPSCSAGFAACTNPQLGCTTPLGTSQHCRNCTESCSGSTPFCESTGCVHFRDIVVAPSGIRSIRGWNGGDGVPQIQLEHTITYAKGENRMVLISVVASDPFAQPEFVTYDDAPLQLAASALEANSWAGIYYILDAALPENAGHKSNVLVKFWNSPVWGMGGFDLIELKNATQAAPFASGSATGSNCGAAPQRAVTVSYTSPGAEPTKYDKSLVYAVLGARGATGATLSTVAGQTETWKAFTTAPDNHLGAAVRMFDNDTRTFTWNVPTCFNSASVGVAVQRLTAPP
jgi:hypothetical protein